MSRNGQRRRSAGRRAAIALMVVHAVFASADETQPKVVFFAAANQRLVPVACVDRHARFLPGRDCIAAIGVGSHLSGQGGERLVVAARATPPGCRQPLLLLEEPTSSSFAVWPASAAPAVLHLCRGAGGDPTSCARARPGVEQSISLDLDGDGKPDRIHVLGGGRRSQLLVERGGESGRSRRTLLPRGADEQGLDERIHLMGSLDLDGDRRDELWISFEEVPPDETGEGAAGQALVRWVDGKLQVVDRSVCWGD
jgi:hypothetical protein